VTVRALVSAELRKTVALPAAGVAAVITVLGSVGLTLLNSVGVREAIRSGHPQGVAYTSPVEAVFSAVPIGTVGAVILGVIAISSEYTPESADAGGGRPITATLTATPRRTAVLVAKALTVALLTLTAAAATIPACLGAADLILDGVSTPHSRPADTVGRSIGVALYWVFTALLALAITGLARSGVIPLILFITNTSVVSVSVLLLHLTALARYLPDLAGIGMFERDQQTLHGLLGALPGGLVMTAWVIVALTISAVALSARDA
jgi:ABC-type transport system involved in multi-copper enzyme maturation permease subunit